MSRKPLLLIDVDGPLNPWAASNRQVPKTFRQWRIEGYKVRLARWHGERLNALTDVFDLMWCTTWEHMANTEIGPRIGLEKLPVIEFEGNLPPQPPIPGLYWKTETVVRFLPGRPFAWVDDEIGARDTDYVQRHHDAPSLLRRIDPMTGLLEKDFEVLREWAEELAVVDEH